MRYFFPVYLCFLFAQPTREMEGRISVLVAREKMHMGDLITEPEKLFQKVFIKPAEVPPNALRDFARLKGSVLKICLRTKQVVTEVDFIIDREEPPCWRIPLGCRAVGFRLNSGEAGMHYPRDRLTDLSDPNCRVDVIVTIKNQPGPSKVLFQSVQVLALETEPNNFVTLALKPDDIVTAELLKVQSARFDLVLRK